MVTGAAASALGLGSSLGGYGVQPSQADAGFGPETGRPFLADGAFTRPLPADPVVDPASDAIMRNLVDGGDQIANVYEFGIPVYDADASTPRRAVDCTERWGDCALEEAPVPLTQDMRPHTGSDMAMVVVDWSTGRSYEFWQYRWNGGRPTTSWGDYTDIAGEGNRVGSTGAGISRLAGVVRTHEVRAGAIEHPLVFSTRFCQRPDGGGGFRYPATKTDGQWSGTGAMPEGGKIQLDPGVDLDAVAGITPLEKMVGTALQKYGAYAIDCGAAAMAFSFENPYGEQDPYPDAGLPWDYWHMPNIPWDELRVLEHWHGGDQLGVLPPLEPPDEDLEAPTVAITRPAEGDVLSGPATVTASAEDAVGVTRVEVFVDGVLEHADLTRPFEFTLDTTTLADAAHSIWATASDAAGNVATSPEVTVTVDNGGTEDPLGTGLTAAYFDHSDLTGQLFERIDPTVDFKWGTGAPAAGMSRNSFSVRWTGQVEAEKTETYTFFTRSDDGVRLWVDQQLIIDNWTDHSAVVDSGTIALVADRKYDIVLEYYEGIRKAVCTLSWSTPGTPKVVIPQRQLYPADG